MSVFSSKWCVNQPYRFVLFKFNAKSSDRKGHWTHNATQRKLNVYRNRSIGFVTLCFTTAVTVFTGEHYITQMFHHTNLNASAPKDLKWPSILQLKVKAVPFYVLPMSTISVSVAPRSVSSHSPFWQIILNDTPPPLNTSRSKMPPYFNMYYYYSPVPLYD